MFKGQSKHRESVFTRWQKTMNTKSTDKTSDKTINKACAEYKQHEINKQRGETGKCVSKHVISLYSTGIFQVVKIKDVHKNTARY